MPSELAEKVIHLLSRNLGHNMAETAVTSSCRSINIDPETIDGTMLGPFADELEGQLDRALGHEKARSMKEKVLNLAEKPKEAPASDAIDREIYSFVLRNELLPDEMSIAVFTGELHAKYHIEGAVIDKNIIQKVRANVRKGIIRRQVHDELKLFLARFPEPTQADLDDFISLVHLAKIDFSADEVMELMEKERLFSKFHGSHEEVASKLDHFVNDIKNCRDMKMLSDMLKESGHSYLVRDESGISDALLSELITLLVPVREIIRLSLDKPGL